MKQPKKDEAWIMAFPDDVSEYIHRHCYINNRDKNYCLYYDGDTGEIIWLKEAQPYPFIMPEPQA